MPKDSLDIRLYFEPHLYELARSVGYDGNTYAEMAGALPQAEGPGRKGQGAAEEASEKGTRKIASRHQPRRDEQILASSSPHLFANPLP